MTAAPNAAVVLGVASSSKAGATPLLLVRDRDQIIENIHPTKYAMDNGPQDGMIKRETNDHRKACTKPDA